jgi:hypothetical protein
MQPAHDQFGSNVGRARDLLGLYTTLSATTAGALDLTDILRAAIVVAVSAFDHLVHEIARIGMLEIYENKRPSTGAFGRFSVTMENVLTGAATPGSLQWLDSEIRRQHSWVSFQQPDKVADAVRLVSSKKLWEEIGTILGIDARSAKDRLKVIVIRRNQIAHEADMDPSSPGARWPIDEILVRDAIDVLVEIADAIYQVVTTP